MKRIFAGLLILILTLGLTACGGSDAETEALGEPVRTPDGETFRSIAGELLPLENYELTEYPTGSCQYNKQTSTIERISLEVRLDQTLLTAPWTLDQMTGTGWTENVSDSQSPSMGNQSGFSNGEGHHVIVARRKGKDDAIDMIRLQYGSVMDDSTQDRYNAPTLEIAVAGRGTLTENSDLRQIISVLGEPYSLAFGAGIPDVQPHPQVELSFGFENCSIQMKLNGDTGKLCSLQIQFHD